MENTLQANTDEKRPWAVIVRGNLIERRMTPSGAGKTAKLYVKLKGVPSDQVKILYMPVEVK